MLSPWLLLLIWTHVHASLVSAGILQALPNTEKVKYDFVIVGGGTAGNTLANRLTENPKYNVLLLEAGPTNVDVLQSQVPWLAPQLWSSSYDWNYTTVPQIALGNRTVLYPRGHILGGTSSTNFMIYTRGASDQHDDYAKLVKDPGWNWKNLRKYFDRNERWTSPADNHNTTGQFDPSVHSFTGINSVTLSGFPTAIDGRVIDAAHQLGGDFAFNLDYCSGNPLGIGWVQTTIDGGVRSSSATSYLAAKFLQRPNLHVVLNAQVSRLIRTSDGSKQSFRTVEFRLNGGGTLQRVTATKEVILSAGAINSPQILLNSGIGPSRHLRSVGVKVEVDHPDVGSNLADHAAIALPWLVKGNDTFETINSNAAEFLAEWQANRTGPFVDTIVSQLGFFRAPDSVTRKGSRLNIPNYEFLIANGLIVPVPSAGPNDRFFTIVVAIMTPASRGTIRLKSNDPFDPPLLDPAFLMEQIDRDIMRVGVKKAIEFVRAPGWSDYIIRPVGDLANITTDSQLDNYILSNTATFFHPTSTNSMSARGAKTGVVDPDLKLKRIRGVRVVDGSVLPYAFAGHPQATIYAIAERIADLLKADYR